MKNKGKPKITASPIRQYSFPPGPWTSSNQEKADLAHLGNIFLQSDDSNVDIDQELVLPVLVEEQPRSFTLQEINGSGTSATSAGGGRTQAIYIIRDDI
jgi:hypothetical protein